MTAPLPQDAQDLSRLAGALEAMTGWSSGVRRTQLLGLRPHLDLAAALAAQLVDSAAHHGRSDASRAAEDLALAVAQLEAMQQSLSTYRDELLALAAEDRLRRQDPAQ